MVKKPPANAGDRGQKFDPSGEDSLENGNLLQYPRLENPRGAWWAKVHGITESDMTEQALTLLF